MTETDLINAIIADNAETAMSLEEIIAKEVRDWRNSREYEEMLTADKYYEYEQDIVNRKRQAIDEDGNLAEVDNLSNHRLQHGFMRKLVDQKAGYLLSKAPVVSTNETSDKKPQQDELTDIYAPLFDKLTDLGTEAVKKGRTWLTLYYDDEGNFLTKQIPSHEVIPLWADSAHTTLQALIRAYDITAYEGSEEKIITKVEWWAPADSRYYILDNGAIIPDVEMADYEGWHYKDGGKSTTWGRVPFICFKYNASEQSLLARVKSLIDDYNLTRSDLSNVLADGQYDMLIFKELDDVDLVQAIVNMNTYRAVRVGADGGVERLGATINLDAIALHLKQLRKDIYEFGRGVDTQSENVIGAAPSGVALKFLYADLDMDCNIIERQFSNALKQYLYFIEIDLNTDYSDAGVGFVFNRASIINEVEQVSMASNSKGIISNRTIAANHPWVDDSAEELEQLAKEKAEEAKANAEAFGMDKT